MLQTQNIHKSYGAETILHSVSFVVNAGERVGLVGPNGCGKSTLLKIIAGQLPADRGNVSLSTGARLGYLPQGLRLDEGLTVEAVMRAGLPELAQAQTALNTLTDAMSGATEETLVTIVDQYGEALTRFETLGGYTLPHRMEKILTGLSLPADKLDTRVRYLSGGQRTRLGLAQLLLAQPDILLLDEPTNHLDIDALEWLEAFLRAYPGAALIVSHDRAFLDQTVTRIIAIDPETHGAKEYTGNYSDYAQKSASEKQKTYDQWREEQAEIRRMEADIHRTKMHAQSVELTTTSRQPSIRRYAKKVAKKAKSREKKLARYKDADERVEKPKMGWQMKLEFGEMTRSGQVVLTTQNLGHRYGDGPTLFRDANLTLTHGDRVALLGGNGSGKSTFLQIITGHLSPSEGRLQWGANVQVGYMPQEQQTLPALGNPLTVIQNARPMSETDARNFLHYFLFAADEVFTPIEKLSYGERARLILAKLVTEGANVLVLDEPINHLVIPSREQFEAALDAFPGTILAAVHDRAFIERFAQRIWRMGNVTIQPELM